MEQLDQKLWDEWLSFSPASSPEDEIAGILDGLPLKTDGEQYKFFCSRLFAVRRLLRLWAESKYQHRSSVSLVHMAQQQKKHIEFCINSEIADGIFERSISSGRRVRNWNWIRGIWGSCGSLYLPKAGYHLVIRPPVRNSVAERLRRILKSAGFSIGLRKKGTQRELMIRDQQQIVTFLSRLGFVQAALALEETAIYRSMRSHANKLVNCDAANINKSLEAAQNQMKIIKQLEEHELADDLPEPLKEIIYARKRNPSVSLKELGQTLPRPISKSTVEYRWRKIENTLYEILKGDGSHVLGKSRR